MARGVRIEIHFPDNTRHEKVKLEDWLFRAARWVGISGGAMYKAVAGYGRSGELRDGGFFDDDRTQPIMASFVTTPAVADAFLAYLAKEGLRLFYTLSEVEYGVVGVQAEGPA